VTGEVAVIADTKPADEASVDESARVDGVGQ
jgi:hypothetical protein